MSTKAFAYVLPASLLILMIVDPWSVGSGQSSKVVVVVEKNERIGQNEARLRVKVTNTSGMPVFSTGVIYHFGPRRLDVYLEQKRGKEGWQLVVPCQDTAPPHVIQLNPAVPMVEERNLKVPLSSVCKRRDIQLEGQFRYRVDYFDSRAQAQLYLEKFLMKDGDKPRPASAYSEPFEIPPFRKPPEAKPKTIRGIVTDEADGPIPEAVVELDCLQKGKEIKVASANSKADGHFEIQAKLQGACRINISRRDFSGVLIPLSDSDRRPVTDLGKIRLRLHHDCSEPGANCFVVTPRKEKD
jgi:hypothetical protein